MTNTNVYIYYIVLILIIVFFSYVNSLNNSTIENFAPFNKFYRPYARNMRDFFTKMYNKVSSFFSLFFKKWNR